MPTPQNTGGSLTIPIIYKGMDHTRGHGYWRSERRVRQDYAVAYIGPKEGDPLNLYHNNLAVCIGEGRVYVRIKTQAEYFEVTRRQYPSSHYFPTQEAFGDDIVKVEIAQHAIMRLIEQLPALAHSHYSLRGEKMTFTGMDHKRGGGYWRPKDTSGVVAYISGPTKGNSFQIDYNTNDDLNRICDGSITFVRILTREQCNQVRGEACSGFSEVEEDYEGDQVTFHVDTIGMHIAMRLVAND
ncbi:hypothetical protein AX14_014439 [Amanita brunnescens Koide BX004]|nr:hypothetical protein AX14_014439 [Amanita brunnescens Koide BX004]